MKRGVLYTIARMKMSEPKRYMLVVDEMSVPYFAKLMPSLFFVEVQALNMIDNNNHLLLVMPKVEAPAQE